MKSLADRTPLHNGVFERLRQMIICCELLPGDRISETELGLSFGVSRTPMREALKLLAAEGLVELRPHKGAVVAEISPTEISDTFALMSALESMSGPLVCERISNIDLQNLTSVVADMDAKLIEKDLSGFLEANATFHKGIVALAGNGVLARVYDDMFDKLQRVRHLVSYDQHRWEDSAVEHRSILEALAARDGGELSKKLQEHARLTSLIVMNKLSSRTE